MGITFSDLLTDCSVALGDNAGTTWDRTTIIWPWCIEAIRTFPILRPMFKDKTTGLGEEYGFELEADFREMISVEYPVNQHPTTYMVRKNRLDPAFPSEAGFYDVDHNYADGAGWYLYFSQYIRNPSHIYVQYLANHDLDMDDDSTTEISVPEEYEDILIGYVLCRGYRERLGFYMQDPTAHMTIITQMTNMVFRAEENYRLVVAAAQARLAQGKVGTHLSLDKFDRVY